MKFRKASLVIGLSLALGAALPAAAHHSAAMYDSAHPVTIEATVKSFEWINPHSVLEVSTEPTAALPTGNLTVEMTSPGVLTRAGWTKRTFKPGDAVVALINPTRDGSSGGSLISIKGADGRVIGRGP